MNTQKGLLGIVGIWLTMALMPLAELLQLSPLMATLLRGVSGVIAIGIAACFGRIALAKPDRQTLILVACFVVATVCLFEAITAWGANRSALFLDLAVLVPVVFAWHRQQVVGKALYKALALAIVGTVLALRAWQGEIVLTGLLFSVGALIANGLFLECAKKAKQEAWNKAFWISAGLVLVGLTTFIGTSFVDNLSSERINTTWLVLAVLFSVGTGVLNSYCFFVADGNLKAVEIGVLVLGVTPAIMLSSYFLLGKGIGLDQLFGVGLTLTAVILFGNLLRAKQST